MQKRVLKNYNGRKFITNITKRVGKNSQSARGVKNW